MAETFGKTVIGGADFGDIEDQIQFCKYTSGSAGDLAKMSVYVRNTTTPGKIKCAIYDASKNLLANGTTVEADIPVADGWVHPVFSTPPTVVATTDYYLACWASNTAITRRDAGVLNQAKWQNIGYGAWPDPFAEHGTSAAEFSIYATYVENQAPTAPTIFQVDGKSAPIGANCVGSTPLFTAIFNDPDAGDISNAIQIQIGTASGLSDIWDSGWLADSTVEGNRCTAKTYAGATLSAGTSYWWHCRFRDDDDEIGAWSAWQQFDVCEEEGRTGSGTGATGAGSSGPGCEPGGPLPKRLAYECPRKDPRKEPAYRFPICSP